MKKTLTFSALLLGLCLTAAIGWRLLKNEAQTPMVYAGTGQNLTGYAWSENIGWISFNSLNCDKNPENNIVDTDAQTPGCAGTGASTTIEYGVNLDKVTGDLSGYAWSDNVGWIYFGPDNVLATTSASAPNDPKIWAHFDRLTGKVTGWAYILSMGNDGWIKMSDDTVPSWAGNGLSISTTTSPIGDFHGWAWNGNNAVGTTTDSGIGWISFNCADAPGGCTASSTYVVHTELNAAPTVTNMTYSICQAPDVGCFGTNAYFGWTYNDIDVGSTENGYQLVLDDNADFGSPVLDTGHCVGYNASDKCAINLGVDKYIGHTNILPAKLGYGTTYYWGVKVWDNMGASSIMATSTFTVGLHELPDAQFSYLPAHPTIGQKIVLTSNSRFYRTALPSTYVPCDDANCHYQWTFTPAAVVYDPGQNDTSSSTIITYNGAGNLRATLTVRDNDNYYATSTPQDLVISAKMPGWKEK